MNLVLHVKKLYFDEIRSGVKIFEYRRVTPYWQRRLEGRKFDGVVICLGYPRRGDATRRLVFPWSGYEVQTITHPHFGDKPVKCYAIRLTLDPAKAQGAAVHLTVY